MPVQNDERVEMTNTNVASAKVVIIGAFPPPVHGMSMVTAYIAKRVKALCPLHATDISPEVLRGNKSIFYHARRMIKVVHGIGTLVHHAGNRGLRFYMPVDAGYGMIYTITLIVVARVFGYRIFVHHHSYAYVDKHMFRMSLLTKCAGALTCHILLCRNMRDVFSEFYPAARNFLTISNAALVKTVARRKSRSSRPLRLGHLSNLSIEKGLDITLDVLAALLERGVSATLILAGPPETAQANAMIEKARARFGAALDYRGAVFEASKEAFFDDTDVFLFPSNYRNEAHPIVILEALSHGIPLIAYARGCIAGVIADSGGICIDPEDDFVATSLPILLGWAANPEGLESASTAAWKRFQHLRDESNNEFEKLLDLLVRSPTS